MGERERESRCAKINLRRRASSSSPKRVNVTDFDTDASLPGVFNIGKCAQRLNDLSTPQHCAEVSGRRTER